jgi:hypothetical protein
MHGDEVVVVEHEPVEDVAGQGVAILGSSGAIQRREVAQEALQLIDVVRLGPGREAGEFGLDRRDLPAILVFADLAPLVEVEQATATTKNSVTVLARVPSFGA